jgi:hypothetical protein
MVLVYSSTNLEDFVRANAGKYSSTMAHMGNGSYTHVDISASRQLKRPSFYGEQRACT